VAPETNPQGDNWHPGGAPSQALEWAAQAVAKAGTIGIIGVYPQQAMSAPIGMIQMRNLTVKGGNCNHRKYIPDLVRMVATGVIEPSKVLTQREPVTGAIEAFETFDRRDPGWVKVILEPAA
jgi:threonine dehydrogenase-like Zn-dependent dehydrogenase